MACSSSSSFTAPLLDTLILILFFVFVLAVLVGIDPAVAVALQWRILLGKVDTALAAFVPALGESAGASAELGVDSSVGLNPVGEGVLAILDDASST